MTAHEAELALVGGFVGGVVAFLAWCLVVSRQLHRAQASIRGFGE